MSSIANAALGAPLIPLRQRNAFLDNLFYDTSSLSADEIAKLSPATDREGAIVVVPPAASGHPMRHYKSALRFVNKEGAAIQAIAVAGVGSSVVGTAALARNVADALNCDVAGIISGYGIADLMSEALGGWFVFGVADRTKLYLENLVESARTTMAELKSRQAGTEAAGFGLSWTSPGAEDVATLSNILLAGPPNLRFLVGHSKGSLLIDFALEQFVSDLEGDVSPLFDRLHVVTFGAVVSPPRQFRHVKQYLGKLDWFGGINSSLSVPHILVDGSWHHLNRKTPCHLDAVAVMRSLAPMAH
jgi:hypothetical protein